jgi:hypothetical protein
MTARDDGFVFDGALCSRLWIIAKLPANASIKELYSKLNSHDNEIE